MIIDRFQQFLKKHGQVAFTELNKFFDLEEKRFYREKISEWKKRGVTEEEAVVKARQGWVVTIGRNLEKVIEVLINDFCSQKGLKVTNDKILKSTNLSVELDKVKRSILVDFGGCALLPDGDIIIYRVVKGIPKVIVILSIKNSFRERYTETPYWKLKLLQSKITKHIKVFMITPDKDDEISFNKRPRKARIVMEYELDGIYLAKYDFDSSLKVKSITDLISDLEKIVK